MFVDILQRQHKGSYHMIHNLYHQLRMKLSLWTAAHLGLISVIARHVGIVGHLVGVIGLQEDLIWNVDRMP